MNRDLFYEIGTEEIPARYINNALKEMKEILTKNLNDLNIQFEEIKIKLNYAKTNQNSLSLPFLQVLKNSKEWGTLQQNNRQR